MKKALKEVIAGSLLWRCHISDEQIEEASDFDEGKALIGLPQKLTFVSLEEHQKLMETMYGTQYYNVIVLNSTLNHC